MKKKNVVFVSGSGPEFLGGISTYQKNLIKYSKDKSLNIDFKWIYPGNKNREYEFQGIRCLELKSLKYPLLKELSFYKKVKKYLNTKKIDCLNTHANWGGFLNLNIRRNASKIVHTYHGAAYPYMKIQFKKFGLLGYLFYPLLVFFYFLEKAPVKFSDKIIFVSKKVKDQIEILYGRQKKSYVIRTGVDLSQFKRIGLKSSRKRLSLDNKKIYGIYSGRGGYWNKGLDRAIKVSEEIYNINKNYRLIVIGADKRKCKKYLDYPFVEYVGIVKREELPYYLSAGDFFFSLSRYEGGAPTLALSEAIACGALCVCSKDMNPEILKNDKDCIIIDSFEESSAQKIIEVVLDNKKREKITENALLKIKELNLNKWAKKYFEVILK